MARFLPAVVAAVVSLGFASAASADDYPSKGPMVKAKPAPKRVAKKRIYKAVQLERMPIPALRWTGLYVGFNEGIAFGKTSTSHTGLPAGALNAGNDYGLNQEWTGAQFGVQAGYNWQLNQWLLGVQADFASASVNAVDRIIGVTLRNGTGGGPLSFVTANQKINYLVTGRLRLGVLATENLLLFASGGLAFAGVSYSGQFHLTAADFSGSDSASRSGWVLGGGLEYRFTDCWSVMAEYMYFNLGSHRLATANNTLPGFQSQFDFNTRGSLARVGVNYKLSGL